MILVPANSAKRLKKVSCLLCAVMLFAAVDAQAEQRAAVTGQEAQVWKQYGFSAADAGEWKHAGFSPAEARRWVQSGIQFPLWADQWRGEGFSPEQVKEWAGKVNVYTAGDFRKFGFGNREALAWIDNGIRSALRAREFRDRGFSPEQAGLWWKRGIFPDEAKTWRDAGFSAEETLEWKYGKKQAHYMSGGAKGYSRAVYSVEWARQWKTAGFTSAEAKQCLLFAMNFDEAFRWKQAGFALQDAFQWKDAGFSLDQAREKREEGLTPVKAEEARDAESGRLDDEILSFHSEIFLHADSTLIVTENVEVQDMPGGEMQGHFERVLAGLATLRHSENSESTTAPSYRLLEVLKEGRPVDYTVKKDSWGDLILRISAGEGAGKESVHQFKIKYMTDCRLVKLHDHDELFFDVTGQKLKMPVKAASATVYLPKGAHLVSADGYAGPREKKYFDVDVLETETGDQVNYSVSRPIKNQMVFQVSVALTKEFARPGLIRTLAHFNRQSGRLLSGVAVFLAGFLFVMVYFVGIWRKVGKDPAAGPIAPQYEPPENLSPAMMGYIANQGRMNAGVLAATLVNLAQRKAVTISQDAGLYTITRRSPPPADYMPEEKAFIHDLFAAADSFVVDKKHARKALRRVSVRMKAVLRQEYRKYFATNSRYLWRFLWFSIIAAGAGSGFLRMPLRDWGPLPLMVYGAFVFTVIGIVLLLFYRLLKAPTPTGRKLMDLIEGFTKVLTANYKRARAFDERPGTDGPPSLEKYLPYAMALGIDSEYVSIRMQNLDWYAGRSAGFSAHDFTTSLSRAAAGAVKRSQTTKRRSGGIE